MSCNKVNAILIEAQALAAGGQSDYVALVFSTLETLPRPAPQGTGAEGA